MTHDRFFLDRVAGWIVEMDRGQAIGFEGNYSQWLSAKSKRLEVRSFTSHSATNAFKFLRCRGLQEAPVCVYRMLAICTLTPSSQVEEPLSVSTVTFVL